MSLDPAQLAVSWALWRIGMIKYMFILSHFSSCFDENSTKKDADVFRVLCSGNTDEIVVRFNRRSLAIAASREATLLLRFS